MKSGLKSAQYPGRPLHHGIARSPPRYIACLLSGAVKMVRTAGYFCVFSACSKKRGNLRQTFKKGLAHPQHTQERPRFSPPPTILHGGDPKTLCWCSLRSQRARLLPGVPMRKRGNEVWSGHRLVRAVRVRSAQKVRISPLFSDALQNSVDANMTHRPHREATSRLSQTAGDEKGLRDTVGDAEPRGTTQGLLATSHTRRRSR